MRCASMAGMAIFLLWSSGRCGTAAATCPRTAGELRVNHGQMLATHNSYHVATSTTWAYSFPPLRTQLEAGVRGFEIDVWWDLDSESFRVLHVVGADEGTTCETLSECLGEAAQFSLSNPCHFPLFFQLELMGTVKSSASSNDAEVCEWSMVEPLAQCASERCAATLPAGAFACVLEKCSEILFETNTACLAGVPCLQDQIDVQEPDEPAGAAGILALFVKCIDSRALLVSGDFDASSEPGATTVFAALEAVLEEAWGGARRVTPGDVKQLEASSNSTKTVEWPLVDDARGRAIFWVTQAPGAWASLADPMPNLFFLGDSAAVRKVDGAGSETSSAARAREAILAGGLVRSRADTADLGDTVSQTRREQTLAGGSQIVSSDYPPVSTAPGAKYPWPPTGVPTFVIPGGTPVGCSDVALEADSGLACDVRALEDLPTAVSSSSARRPGVAAAATVGCALLALLLR